jgi:type II secretory pathway component PulF
MPTFEWTGLDLAGNTHKGMLDSSSIPALRNILATQEIALMSARPQKKLFRRKWASSDTLALFSHLHELLQAGLFLPDALAMVRTNEKQSHRKELIAELEQQVATGVPLSLALAEQPKAFSPLTITMVKAGEETGQLPNAFSLIAQHFSFSQTFKQRLKTAATMPLISFVFFVVVFCFILFGLLPKIALLFAQQKHELPALTRTLLAISAYCSNSLVVITASATGFITLLGLRKLRVTKPMLFDKIITYTPVVGHWARQRALVYFFKTLSLLLDGKISLIDALTLAQQSIVNRSLRREFDPVITAISKGTPMSRAITLLPWAQEAAPIIALGEQTGKLDPVIARAAVWYEQRFVQSLDRIAIYLQPALILFMGLCIAGLICAVYVPIISLAGAVKF